MAGEYSPSMPANLISKLLLIQSAQLEAAALAMLERDDFEQNEPFEVAPADERHDLSPEDVEGVEEDVQVAPQNDSEIARWVERTAKLSMSLGYVPSSLSELAKWCDQLPHPDAPPEEATKYLLPTGALTNNAILALSAWMERHPQREQAEAHQRTRIERRARNAMRKKKAAPSEDEAASAKADEAASEAALED